MRNPVITGCSIGGNITHYPMFEDPQQIADITAQFCRRHGIL